MTVLDPNGGDRTACLLKKKRRCAAYLRWRPLRACQTQCLRGGQGRIFTLECAPVAIRAREPIGMTGSQRVICITFIHLQKFVAKFALACAHIRLSRCIAHCEYIRRRPRTFLHYFGKSFLIQPYIGSAMQAAKDPKRKYQNLFSSSFPAVRLHLPPLRSGTIKRRPANAPRRET